MLQASIVFFLLALSPNRLHASENKLRFGIVPQQSPANLIKVWMPLIENLRAKCKCEIDFASAIDISTFEANIQNREYDIVYLNPFHYVKAESRGYKAIVTEKERKLKGVLVVRADSGTNSLDDLKNSKIAFPGPTAFAASVLIENLLNQNHVSYEPVYVKSHESVYTGVISGLFKAGGGINRTFEALSDDKKKQLKILRTSIAVTPHPIAIHSRVDQKIQLQIQEALIALKDSPDGVKILDDLELKPLVKADSKDWDDVRELVKNIEKQKVKK